MEASYVAAITNFEPIAKATDENLTSENWEFIMDVCDKVTTGESGAKDAVASMIKRLAHRNANVQLYTLEVWNITQAHPWAYNLTVYFSLQMPSVRIVVQRCTESWPREPLRMLC